MNRKLRVEIEARKQAEQLARSESEAKTHFLAVLAHEVRSPLSGILSSLWLYDSSGTEKEKQEIVDIAEGSAANLLRMVDNILDHSKLETGKMEAECLPVTLHEFLTEIIQLFHASALAKGIDILLEFAPGVPSIITTDPSRLRQILSNLLSNAVKFTETGSVRISVSAAKAEADGQIFFDVSDSGPGLTPSQMERIFQPYTQGDMSVARHYGGTGLGLSISLQLARLLGGDITVQSKEGYGATFTLAISVPEVS